MRMLLVLGCADGPVEDSARDSSIEADADTDADSDTDSDADSDTDSDTDVPLITDYAWVGSFGEELSDPRGVAIFEERLVIADTGNGRLVEITLEGELVGSIAADVLDSPKHLSFDSGGGIWVADTASDQVHRIVDGVSEGTFGEDLSGPYAAVTDDTRVWISDYDNNRIRVYATDGTWLEDFGDAVELDKPSGLLLDPDGRLLVASTGGDRIQVYEDGVLVDTLGQGLLNDPHQMAWDPDGSLWVADQFNYRVVKLDADGHEIASIGERGSEDGQVDWPFGVAVGPDRRIYVADMKNDRVGVWAPSD